MDPRVEFAEVVLVVRVVETEHRAGMRNCRKIAAWLPADAPRGGVVARPVGMLRLDLLQPAYERVVLRVGDGRIGEDVVAVFVLLRLLDEAVVFSARHGPGPGVRLHAMSGRWECTATAREMGRGVRADMHSPFLSAMPTSFPRWGQEAVS